MLNHILIIALVLFFAAISFIVLGAPEGLIDFGSAFGALRLLAYTGAVFALIAARRALSKHPPRRSRVLSAIIALGFAIPVLTLAINEASAPPGDFINDITTDPDDPPMFSAVTLLRKPGSNPIEYGGSDVAARQRTAYPSIIPVYTNLDRDRAFQKAFETAESLGWEIVAADPYTGIIEAIDITPFFRFKDDVVIRLRDDGSQIRIDLRSRSRVGMSDLGMNAKRINKFVQAFNQ